MWELRMPTASLPHAEASQVSTRVSNCFIEASSVLRGGCSNICSKIFNVSSPPKRANLGGPRPVAITIFRNAIVVEQVHLEPANPMCIKFDLPPRFPCFYLCKFMSDPEVWLAAPAKPTPSKGIACIADPYVSRIGGPATWLRPPTWGNRPKPCSKCKTGMILLTQFHAPLKTYDRIIYVLCCPKCSKTSNAASIEVLRCQGLCR